MKRIVIAALLLSTTLSAYAQSSKSKGSNVQYLSLGPVLGVGGSWVSNMDDQKFKPSVHLGVNLIYSKHEHIGWGAELTASHEGFKVKDPIADIDLSVDPVYLRLTPKFYYFFGNYGSTVRPKLYAGPSIGFKVAEDQFLDGNKSDGKSFFNDEDLFNTLDLGLTAGAGVNIKIAKSAWLNLDANYYHGFLDVTDNDVAGTDDNNTNSNLRLNVGVMFGL